MKIQQYKTMCSTISKNALLGFVFAYDDTELLAGFVSATDFNTYVEITLFNPVERDCISKPVWDCKEQVEFEPIFSRLMDDADETVQAAWNKVIHAVASRGEAH